MVITEIKECARNKKRVNLYSNGEFVCALYYDTVFENNINTGCDISDDDFQRILSDDEKRYALVVASRYINARMHSQYEIEYKLKKKGFDKDICSYVIDKFTELGYIDDVAFANMYIAELEHSCGLNMIKQKLIAKGLSKDIISDLCGTLDQRQSACNFLEKYVIRHTAETDRNKMKQKIYRSMTAKGFRYEDINYALMSIKWFDDEMQD